MIGPRPVAALLVAAAPACSLFVTLDDLKVQADASTDASPTPDVADVADAAVVFLDDFNRADDPDIGNGWIEKNAAAFALVNGSVLRGLVADAGDYNYQDNIVYRPTSESMLNVEVSVDVTFDSMPPGYAQIWARVPDTAVLQPSNLTGYLLYVNGGTATIARSVGTTLTDLANVNFPSQLVPNHAYRLRLDVQGVNPVQLAGYVDDLVDGGASSQTTFADTDATQITTAGTVGFSGSYSDTSQGYTYDNFTRRGL